MRTLSLPLYSRRTLTVRTQRGRDPDELTAPCLNMRHRSTICRTGNVEATWEEEKPISRGVNSEASRWFLQRAQKSAGVGERG